MKTVFSQNDLCLFLKTLKNLEAQVLQRDMFNKHNWILTKTELKKDLKKIENRIEKRWKKTKKDLQNSKV